MNKRTLARLVATLGLAAAVAIGTAGPAGAQPPGAEDRTTMAAQPDPPQDPGTGDPATQTPDPRTTNPGPPPGSPDPRVTNPGLPDPHAAAPTENLRRLANALVVRNKGIYLNVSVPAGLNVGPIEISIGYGAERFTRTYNNAAPAEYTLDFPPLTGAARQEYVSITLTERVPGGPYHYAIVSQVEVAPLYTVTLSELRFVTGGCDFVGEADPTFEWVDPDGGQHRFRGDGNEVVLTGGFAGTWTGVDEHRGLTMPTIEWMDRDAPGFGPIGASGPLPRGGRLLPFAVSYPNPERVVQDVQATLPDLGGDCSAQVRYTVTLTPEGTTV